MTHYEQCSDGPFWPCREHDSRYGWGVRYKSLSGVCSKPNGVLFALVGAKGCAHGLAAALNGHWEAAKVFIEGDHMRDSQAAGYMERFK